MLVLSCCLDWSSGFITPLFGFNYNRTSDFKRVRQQRYSALRE